MPVDGPVAYKIDKPNLRIWIEDNVMYFQYLSVRINLEEAVQCMKDRLSILDGKEYLLLINSRNVKKFDHDARRRMEHDDARKGIIKTAIVVNSKVQEVMANFFLYINKPKVPLRIFTKEDEALRWLKK